MQKLNILVVDDEKRHRDSAHALLGDHNLTVVSSYDEAAKLLTPGIDWDVLGRLKESARLGQFPREGTESEKAAYNAREEELEAKAYYQPNFDVVLLDLLMPASANAQGGEGMAFVGKLMPVGTFLILLAMHVGVKRIGMVTDTNHHHHPASAALDPISRTVIKVGETWVYCTNEPNSVRFDAVTGEMLSSEFLGSPEGKALYPWTPSYDRVGVVYGKGWNGILQFLLDGGETSGS
jgi:CheY-like chemotaxis protein